MRDAALLQSVFAIVATSALASLALWSFFAAGTGLRETAIGSARLKRIAAGFLGATLLVTTLAIPAGVGVWLEGALIVIGALLALGGSIHLWREAVSQAPESYQATRDSEENLTSMARAVDEARKRLHDIVEISGDWIWQTDENGYYTYISDGVRKVQAKAIEDYLGRPLFSFNGEGPEATSPIAYDELIVRREPFRNVIVHCKSETGAPKVVRISGMPMFHDNQKFRGYHGLGSDITDEYLIQEERASAVAKDKFLAAMSHEIRTPLNGVLGILEILHDANPTADQRHLLNTAMDSGQSLLHLINDVLDFSRIQAGHLTLDPQPADLDAAIRSAIGSLETLASKRTNVLKIETAGTMPAAVVVDIQRYRQILVNLLGNAIKFTERGKIVTKVAVSDVGSKVRIRTSVTDTGPGIPESKQSLLFKEFSMLDDPTRINANGTGLGLALCKKLVDAMNGRIGLESKVGKGSTFWFEIDLEPALPLVRNEDGAQQTASTLSMPDRPIKILVAEDNPTNVLVVQRMLGGSRFRVQDVANGKLAIEAIAKQTFDLVLMDISMPVMDGVMATIHIREMEKSGKRPRTPIIALTAHAVTAELERVRQSGVDAILSKPIRKAALLDEISRLVAMSDAARRKETISLEPTPPSPVPTAEVAADQSKVRAASAEQSVVTGNSAGQARTTAPAPSGSGAERIARLGPVLQPAVVKALAEEMGPEVFTALMTTFRREMNTRRQELEAAEAGRDVVSLRKTCHAVAGSAATIGAVRLERLCRQIEQACIKAEKPEYLTMVKFVTQEMTTLLSALESERRLIAQSVAA